MAHWRGRCECVVPVKKSFTYQEKPRHQRRLNSVVILETNYGKKKFCRDFRTTKNGSKYQPIWMKI